MPGLNQLKQLSTEVLGLGDELKLRSARGEKPAEVHISSDISDRDDSDDFILGLPETAEQLVGLEGEENKNEPVAAEPVAETGTNPEAAEIPDLGDILNTSVGENEPDFSDFLKSSTDGQSENEIADMDLDALLNGMESDSENAPSVQQSEKNQDEKNIVQPDESDSQPGVSEDNPAFEEAASTINMNADLPGDVAETDAVPKRPPLGSTADIPEGAFSDFDISEKKPVVVPEKTDGLTDAGSQQSAGETGTDIPAESFDISAMDDFASEDAEPKPEKSPAGDFPGSLPDFDFPETDTKIGPENTDFELAGPDDFEIPGFSDTGKAVVEPSVETADFAGSTPAQKNTLTDEEYQTFRKNLTDYPLNVRIAVEDLIVKNEFTDEAVFEVINKIVKKLPARQVAAHLEKMLDITLNVPRNYERRSFAEYEAYKSSIQYQLKNRVIPGLLVAVGVGLIAFCLFLAIKHFVYRPLMAGNLYSQGYELLQSDEYPQADIKFNEAVVYRASKKWFYRYARGYRVHKQYNRAETMYMKILNTFNFDKPAGLEYANMEMADLANYEKAETIDRRLVLDHHINDRDGLLLLGDIFLEWATEKDPEKFELAREQYASLVQLYGPKDLYLSRMMRYFIRTDNLREVLNLKEHFYKKKDALDSQDLTELSGYLLHKQYGQLAPSDEYLRSSIEDVRTLLERAVDADPSNPVALYNMAWYFVKVANFSSAQSFLSKTITAFKTAPTLKKTDVYKQIDAYSQLGRLYCNDREYIKAEKTYTDGIGVFEENHVKNGLAGTSVVGHLYENMADLDYFISGDLDNAMRNYKNAITNVNDTPSIRYRIGVIDYGKENYGEALDSFMKASENVRPDNHLLLALGNVLTRRDDNYAAEGYYEDLLKNLDVLRNRRNILLPQVRADDAEIVNLYMKAANNLGVVLYRLARQTGDSSLNAEAMVRLSESLRAWDALSRNQDTLVRLEGSNLALQNMQYITHPQPAYEPAIYADIPRILSDQKGLQ